MLCPNTQQHCWGCPGLLAFVAMVQKKADQEGCSATAHWSICALCTRTRTTSAAMSACHLQPAIQRACINRLNHAPTYHCLQHGTITNTPVQLICCPPVTTDRSCAPACACLCDVCKRAHSTSGACLYTCLYTCLHACLFTPVLGASRKDH